jgi:hypothetical protein
MLVLVVVTLILCHDLGININWVPKSAWTATNALDGERLALAVVTAIVGFPTGIGLLRKRLWAYYSYTVMNGFSIGLSGAEVGKWHQWSYIPSLIFNCVVLLYMLLPGVKKAFT